MKKLAILAIAILAITFTGCATMTPPPEVPEPQWEKSMVRFPVLGPKLDADGKVVLDKDGKPTATLSYVPTKVDMKTGRVWLLLPDDSLNAKAPDAGVKE